MPGRHRRTGGGGRHERPPQCSFTWTAGTGQHTSHSCVNAPKPGSNQCGGPHLCRNWECSEVHP